jgi:hypothetical protein
MGYTKPESINGTIIAMNGIALGHKGTKRFWMLATMETTI